MKGFRDHLSEMFERPFRFDTKWKRELMYGSIVTYEYIMDTDEEDNTLTVNFGEESEDSWTVDFLRGGSVLLTGKGSAARVFATVLDALRRFIREHKPQVLMFSASKEELSLSDHSIRSGSRVRAYAALIKRYAPQMGYEMISHEKQDGYAGGEEHLFVLKKVAR